MGILIEFILVASEDLESKLKINQIIELFKYPMILNDWLKLIRLMTA